MKRAHGYKHKHCEPEQSNFSKLDLSIFFLLMSKSFFKRVTKFDSFTIFPNEFLAHENQTIALNHAFWITKFSNGYCI